jgi:GH25 family lysozyme M1 (1,4-beta-N-acetylmuramidase)
LVESAIGKRPLLYTSSAYLKHLGSPAELTNYPLWLMNEPSSPRIPPSGLRYLIWQTSGEGDLSASVFNGSAAELLRLAR